MMSRGNPLKLRFLPQSIRARKEFKVGEGRSQMCMLDGPLGTALWRKGWRATRLLHVEASDDGRWL